MFFLTNIFSRTDLTVKDNEELIEIIEHLRNTIIDLELKKNLQEIELKKYRKFDR